MRRLLLVRHAPTRATRTFAFPLDEPIEPRAISLPSRHPVLSSPSLRCLQTAEGLSPTVDERLAECDFGSWGGRTLEEIDEAGVRAWMTDPDAAPHGGESLRTFSARIGAWLDEQAALDGGALVITHGGVVKAAVVHALGAPIEAFWRIDVTPLHVTELHAHDARWTLTRANAPLEAAPTARGEIAPAGRA